MSSRPSAANERVAEEAPRVLLPREVALRLKVSLSMLRKLTVAGEIGHVRLGCGAQRLRVGYTEAHVADFIATRSVPASRQNAAAQPARVPNRRQAGGSTQPKSNAARQVLDSALATGAVAPWRVRP